MKGYWIARSKINDPVAYKRYTDLVPAIVAAHGGKMLARGGAFEVLEGPQKFGRFVVIEFASLADARACFQSQAYQQASQFRLNDGAGEVELVIVEGVAP